MLNCLVILYLSNGVHISDIIIPEYKLLTYIL